MSLPWDAVSEAGDDANFFTLTGDADSLRGELRWARNNSLIDAFVIKN
jgi:hypothetical protein